MASGFFADLSTGDGYAVVSLSGELDLAESPGLRRTLDRVLRSSTRLIVIDAAELTFLDSTGIGVIVAAYNRQVAAGGRLVITNLNEVVGRPIRLTEVDTAIPVHWTCEVLRPWAEPGATPSMILAAFGFAAEGVDADTEPIS